MMAVNKTVQAIFDKAIYLMDSQNEGNGSTETVDTKEYKLRTIAILNNLLDTVYPASDTYTASENGKRAALPDIESFSDELDLDARILREVLPNGLAAKLLTEENPTLSNYFQQCFEQGLAAARMQMPARFESIGEDIGFGEYGGIEYGDFAHW